jgi:beta-galactosidase GanA
MAMIMLTKNVSNRNMALTLVAWLVIPAVIMGTSLGDGLIEEATRGGAWVVVLLTAIVAGKIFVSLWGTPEPAESAPRAAAGEGETDGRMARQRRYDALAGIEKK